jgi:iron complex transport system permease protein
MATTASISALTIVLVLASVFVAIAAKPAKAFELGSAKAETLGFTINRWTLALVAVAVLLSAFATATVGPIAFVALLSGPIASRLSGGQTNAFALSSTIGAGLTIASDLLIALLFGSQHLPTGLVTGLIGSAFLIAIIFRKKGGASV